MDTFLYIVIAIAIMAYQIYNENKKKEQKKNAASNSPSRRVDTNQGYKSEFAHMFDSLSSINGLEDDELQDESDSHLKYVKSVPTDFSSPYHNLGVKQNATNIIERDNKAIERENRAQGRKKQMPEIMPKESLETSEARAYNIDVPINKTDAQTKQLLDDIYDSSEISSHSFEQKSQNKTSVFGEGFDPRLFILYSAIVNPKFRD